MRLRVLPVVSLITVTGRETYERRPTSGPPAPC